MTPLHRSVPQRRRRNITVPFIRGVAALIIWAIFIGDLLFWRAAMRQPSRLQPVLDRTEVTGVVEVVR